MVINHLITRITKLSTPCLLPCIRERHSFTRCELIIIAYWVEESMKYGLPTSYSTNNYCLSINSQVHICTAAYERILEYDSDVWSHPPVNRLLHLNVYCTHSSSHIYQQFVRSFDLKRLHIHSIMDLFLRILWNTYTGLEPKIWTKCMCTKDNLSWHKLESMSCIN